MVVARDAGPSDLRARSIGIILANQAPSGAFVAGPTFSQYGYAWFRDGAFIAEALDLVGEHEASTRFHSWVTRVVLSRRQAMERAMARVAAGSVPDAADVLHCRYTVDGSAGPADWPLFQLDGPGIWLWSLAHHVRAGGRLDRSSYEAGALVARYLAALRDVPAHDAWEETPDVVHTSTLLAILAGLRAADELGMLEAAGAAACRELEATVLAPVARPWTKWPGMDAVDASLLWAVVPYGLVGTEHPAAEATIERVERELVDPDGGVHRYRDDVYYGGGAWLLLTAALARVRLRRAAPGDRELAAAALGWIERQAGPDGELPEQVATHALHPEQVDRWRARWGDSACPLLWSHAAYLALATELEAAASR